MVLVEEVKEEIIVDRESDYETESEFSEDDAESVISEDDFDPSTETFADRVAALKDIVPPETRKSLANTAETIKSWSSSAYNLSGNIAWWVCTSAILVALPLALASENEAMITQQERELQMQSTGQQQVSTIRSSALAGGAAVIRTFRSRSSDVSPNSEKSSAAPPPPMSISVTGCVEVWANIQLMGDVPGQPGQQQQGVLPAGF